MIIRWKIPLMQARELAESFLKSVKMMNTCLSRWIYFIIHKPAFKCIYNEKQIPTSLSTRSFKKIIWDTCQKTAFSFDNKIYEQLDGVSMSGSLRPVLANIIMTECEKVIVDKLMEDGITKYYERYVDDTRYTTLQSILLKTVYSFSLILKFVQMG